MHRHARQRGDFVIVRTNTILRDDVAQELDSRGADRVLFEESSDLCANAHGRQLESLRNSWGSRLIRLHFKRHLDHVESGRNEKHYATETGGPGRWRRLGAYAVIR